MLDLEAQDFLGLVKVVAMAQEGESVVLELWFLLELSLVVAAGGRLAWDTGA